MALGVLLAVPDSVPLLVPLGVWLGVLLTVADGIAVADAVANGPSAGTDTLHMQAPPKMATPPESGILHWEVCHDCEVGHQWRATFYMGTLGAPKAASLKRGVVLLGV